MRLNLQTDYALRMLTHLAVNEDRLVTVAEISDRFSISRNHLVKVSQTLGQLGFVKTVRGRNGGFRLGREAGAISLGEVVRQIENDFAFAECMQANGGQCLIAGCCRLEGVLRMAGEAFLAVLDRYTVADLTAGNPDLRNLLQSEAA